MAGTVQTNQAQKQYEEYRQSQDKFKAMAAEYERLAAQDPEAHRGRIKRFMAFGYSVMFGMVLLAFGLMAGVILLMVATGRVYSGEIKILIFVGIFWIYLVRSLWVTLPDAEGYSVSRSEAPKLWAEVDDLTDKLQAPRVQKIVLNMEYNAFAAHYRTHGYWGRQKTTLGIGLPLMMTMNADEFRFVLAHEFGHFSGRHGVLGAKVGALYATLGRMEAYYRSRGKGVLSGFLSWFLPKFDAMTLALRRQQEYEADAVAVQLTSKEAAASALLKLCYGDEWVSEGFWKPFGQQAMRHESPPVEYYRELATVAKTPPSPDMIAMHVQAGLRHVTDPYHSHPSMKDRLNAVDVETDGREEEFAQMLAEAEVAPASDVYLADTMATLTRVGSVHAKEAQEGWKGARENLLKRSRRLQDLEDMAQKAPLAVQEAVEHAMLKRSLYPEKEAEVDELILRLAGEHPQNALAQYAAGLVLADRKTLDAVPYFERAGELDLELLQPARRSIADLKHQFGLHEQVEELKEAYVKDAIYEHAFEQQMANIGLGDRFITPDVSAGDLGPVRQQLGGLKDLGDAYLVTKVHPQDPRWKMNMLFLFSTKKMVVSKHPNAILVEEAVKIDFPFQVFIFGPEKDIKKWKEKLDRVPGAKLV